MEGRPGGRYAVAATGRVTRKGEYVTDSGRWGVEWPRALHRCRSCPTRRTDRVACPASRPHRSRGRGSRFGRRRHRMRCHRRGIVSVGVRSGGRSAGRYRQPHLHARHQPARSHGRHRRRHVAAHFRHQRHWRVAGDGGGDSAPDGLCGQSGLPLFGRGHLRAAVARSRRLRRQQSRAGKTRGGLAG